MVSPLVIAFQAVLAAAVVLTIWVGAAVWSRRETTGATPLLVLMFGTTVWVGSDLAIYLVTSDRWTMIWLTILWIGSVIVPTAAFVFVLEYTGREHLVTRRTVAALAVVPVVTFALVLTSEYHNLIWTDVNPLGNRTTSVELSYGRAFWGYILYSYGLLAIATALVMRMLYRSATLYRGQAALLVVAIVGPWLGNLGYLVEATTLDLTPLGFAITSVALGVAIVRYRLGDVVPVARNTVVDNITDGVLVLDRNDRIVDANGRGRALLSKDGDFHDAGRDARDSVLGRGARSVAVARRSRDPVVGRDAREVVPASIVDRFDGVERGTDELTIESDGATRHLSIDVSPLEDRRDRRVGRLFIVRDVTDRRRYQRELERQNEQLDRFAGLVSHDLRNPLSVAMGYLDLVAERHDDPDIEEVRRSLDRMERITDDVLTLAREGRPISERESVSLARIATEAWENVATADATLAVEVDHEVRTDPSRLVQAFENLYRNAVEHGGDDVAVEVGPLEEPAGDAVVDGAAGDAVVDGPAGFSVADDGPGIPDDELDAVLDAGYSTASDGTGFGLHIVETIVEAHGWGLSVANGDDGGARFDVRYGAGVDPATGQTKRPA